MFQYILFDLDGTLTDPKEGITKSVQFALRQQGIKEPNLNKLEPFIGPPLRDSFMDFYDMTQEQADMAVADYRKRFAPVGIYENKVYPGIPEMLAHLQAAGISLAVASSKPEKFVLQILEHFNLASYFDVVVGSGMDGSLSSKEEVVEEALRRLEEQEEKAVVAGEKKEKEAVTEMQRGRSVAVDRKEKGVMVGDRKYDINGGREFGLTTAGVSFGYAGKGELEAAGADYIAGSVSQLEKFLLGEITRKKSNRRVRTDASSAGRSADAKAVRADDGSNARGISGVWAKTWDIMFPFILYYLGSNACYIVIVTIFRMFSSPGAGPDWMYENSVGVASLAKACSMLAGACVLIPLFRRERTGWQPRTKASFIVMGILAVTAALGVNILFGLLRIAAMSAGYYETEQMQYQIPFPAGLLLYGLISPLAEEMLFRGLIYNRMKKYFSMVTAGVSSAALFGLYHGNLVQALYGMLMGILLAYAYEISGSFRIPVWMHGAANVCVFTVTYYPAVGRVVGMPVNCAVFLGIAGGLLGMMWKKRIRA